MGKFLNKKKKTIFIGLILGLSIFLWCSQVQAQTLETGLGYAAEAGLGTQDIRITIANIIRVILGILGLVAVVIIIYGGFLYMTAAGEVEKIKTAKKLLAGAVIGLIIILSSFAIASFVISQLQQAVGPGGPGGGGGPGPGGCEGSGCYPPAGFCLDPRATMPDPYICSLSPNKGKIGDFVTIKGGKFAAFNTDSSQVVFVKGEQEYQAEIVLCGNNPSWNDTQVVVEVPNDLPYTENQINTFKVIVRNANGSSDKKPTGGLTPTDQFTLEVGQPGPGIACIVPASGKENTAIEVLGKRFGSSQEDSILLFRENIEATVTSWTDVLLQSTVPPNSISGDVKVTAEDRDSNGYYFTVPCDEDDDCFSGCCYQSWLGKSCAEASYCLPGLDQSCDPDEETKEICETGGQCQTNLVCDDVSCRCRYPQAGDACDGDIEADDCQVDNNKCGPGLFCAESTCLCEEMPQITKVEPNDGAPGNYITILGKGFGEIDMESNLLSNSSYETSQVNWAAWTQAAAKVAVSDQQFFSGTKSLLIHQDANEEWPGKCSQALCLGQAPYEKYPYRYDAGDKCLTAAGTYRAHCCTWANNKCNFGSGTAGGPRSVILDVGQNLPYPYENRNRHVNFGYNVANILTEPNAKYLVSFKYKGKLLADVNLALNWDINTGDATWGKDYTVDKILYHDENCTRYIGSWPNAKTCEGNTNLCCIFGKLGQKNRYLGQTFTIPKGEYLDWQNFDGVYLNSDHVLGWIGNQGQHIAYIGFGLGTDVDTKTFGAVDLFIDDFEIRKISTFGQVNFCGFDMDGNNEACDDDGDDQLAKFPFEINPFCDFSGCWHNDQIVVAVPAEAEDGPIEVVVPSGLKDQTNDANGVLLPDFDVNSIKRPSICALQPNRGPFNTSVVIRGTGFGNVAGKALIGNEPFGYYESRNIWGWAENVIQYLRVPNITPALLPVQVQIGNIFSNPMNFSVLHSADLPQIDYIDPKQGPAGQYITIFGKNFGYTAGEVRFDNQDEFKDNWILGDTNFPAKCQTQYWHDKYIVVKVPDYESLSASNIVVRTAQKFYSNAVSFTHMATGTPSPGVCAIIPDQGPAGTAGVTLYGENFGNYNAGDVNQAGASKVTFYKGQEITTDLAGYWTNQQVGSGELDNAPLTVPELAETGPVQLTNGGLISNQISFEVSDCREDASVCKNNMQCCSNGVCQQECPVTEMNTCFHQWSFTTGERILAYGPPQVVEDPACTDNLQSPSPWKRSQENCTNALISARFIQNTQDGVIPAEIDTATLVESNIIINSCGTDAEYKEENCVGDALVAETIGYESKLLPDGTEAATSFIFNSQGFLEQNTWYRVILKSDPLNDLGIKSVDDIYLDGDRDTDGLEGGDYVWYFKTRDSADACPVDNIIVTPPSARMTLITQTQEYNAYPLASNCNILNPGDYTWNWWKKYSGGITEDAEYLSPSYGVALLTPKEGFVGTHKKIAIPKKQGLVNVAASIFSYDDILYKEDSDNLLIVDLNIPEITGFSPKDGLIRPEVNSYVIIKGRNFGSSQGSSKVYFDDVPAKLADCSTAWNNTEIKVVAPKPVATSPSTEKTYILPKTSAKDGMVLFYDFEEDSQVIVEDKVGNSMGEIKNGQRINDLFNKAFQCKVGSYIKTVNKLNLDSGSIELWFNPVNRISFWGSTLVNGYSSTGSWFKLNILMNATSKAWRPDKWNHLVYTYDKDKQERVLYINGYKYTGGFSAVGFEISGDFINPNQPEIYLGKTNTAYSSFYYGLIDNFAIYNKVLSKEEVWANYGLKAGQIMLLDFEEVGDQIIDSSANNWAGFSVANTGEIFRTAEGKYGNAITFNNNNRINIEDNSSLVFSSGLTIQGWFKVDSTANNIIYEANRMYVGIYQNNLMVGDRKPPSAQLYVQTPIPTDDPQWLSQWHYFAAVYDGKKVKAYLDSVKTEYPPDSDMESEIYQDQNLGDGCIGGCSNNFSGLLDNFSIYNRALTDEEIYKNIGTKDNSWIRVVTAYGEDNTDFNNNKIKNKARGETFTTSENVYPFLCQLVPNYGVKGIKVDVDGDNLGDSNKTTYRQDDYGVGSYLRFSFNNPISENMTAEVIDTWNNRKINYVNPLEDLMQTETLVWTTIDPYSEPYNDINATLLPDVCLDPEQPAGSCDSYADLNGNSQYDKHLYNSYYGRGQQELPSNSLPFYQPPVITRISPDNGPAGQWVSIMGYNFGQYKLDLGDENYAYGKIYFYNQAEAELAPCEIGSWSDNLIIAVVPPDVRSGDVYIMTAYEIESNRKTYTLNDKPLGPGLCYLKDESNQLKYSGKANDFVRAVGDKFGDEQGSSNLVFFDKQMAEVPDPVFWTNTTIDTYIPIRSESGDVVVMKVVEKGRRCAGFSIGSWCPSGKYDIITEEIPSNPWPLTISDTGCAEVDGIMRDVSARDLYGSGADDIFPIETYILENGQKVPYDDLNVSIMATDGTYLYAMANNYTVVYGTFYGLSGEGDTPRTIWQIGTGNPGTDTDLGRVYKRWHFNPSQNVPAAFNWSCADRPSMCHPVASIVATKNGLYLGHQMHTLQHYWLANTDPDYSKEFFGIAKINFHDCPAGEFTCEYSLEYQEISQAILRWPIADYLNWPCNIKNLDMRYANHEHWGYVILTSNGDKVYAISVDLPGGARIEGEECINDNLWRGYTFQELDGYNWGQTRMFSVKRAEKNTEWESDYYQTYWQQFVADSQTLYSVPERFVREISLEKQEWISSVWQNNAESTMEYFGTYDWTTNKFWFGSWRNDEYNPDNPLLVVDAGKHNRIYRYANCPLVPTGLCRADVDCWNTGCKNSYCVNGKCTPEIVEFSPPSGPIGTWVSLHGCHFCCATCGEGEIYFSKDINTTDLTNTLVNGAIARYKFDDPANPGKNSISDQFNGTLAGEATVNSGQLVLDGNGDYLDLANSGLLDAATYGGTVKGRGQATISIWVKPSAFGYWGTIIRRIAGLHYMALSPDGILQILFFNEYDRTNKYLSAANKVKLNQWTHLVYTIAAESGVKLFVNGELVAKVDNSAAFRATLAAFWSIEPAIGAKLNPEYSDFQGTLDDALIYNWELSEAQVLDLYLSYRAKGLDCGEDCKATWRCSTDKNTYDEVMIEVPNEDTLNDYKDDAITGYLDLLTSDGRYTNTKALANPNFTVNTEPKGPQVCLLEPSYGNRGVTIKIIGEKFDESRVASSYVRFEPDIRLDANDQPYIQEPFTDLNDNNRYDSGETFVDKNNNSVYDFYLPESFEDANDNGVFDAGDILTSDPNNNGRYDEVETYDDNNPTDGQYTEPEPYIDLNNNSQYNLSGLNPSDYTFNIADFPQDKNNCPASGWSDKNICFNVPLDTPNILGNTASAGGFGTDTGQAIDFVSVHKTINDADRSSAKLNFNVTFGSCGNQKWEPDFGEQCDGLDKDSRITCEALDYPEDCEFQCTNQCRLLVCDPVTWECEEVLDILCGDGEILSPLEDCDCGEDDCTADELANTTCETLDFKYGTLSCYQPNDGDPKQCTFDTRMCKDPLWPGRRCKTNQDCQLEDCDSICVNGKCAPYIRTFTPDNGALGTWVTVNGCYFGCTPGKVYFSHGFEGLPEIYKSSLVAGYEFAEENPAGVTPDLTGNYNAILENGAFISEGALYLNGGSYLNLGKLYNKNLFKGQITFIAKLKWTPTAGLATLLSYTSGIPVSVISNDGLVGVHMPNVLENVELEYRGQWAWSMQKIKPDQWTEIAIVVKQGYGVQIFINGILDSEYANLQVPFYSNADVNSVFGKEHPSIYTWYSNFNGTVDQMYIFDRGLSEREIDELYRLSFRESLVTDCPGYWQCSKKCAYGQNINEICDADIDCPCAKNETCPEQRCLPDYINDNVIIEVPNKNTETIGDDAWNVGPVMLVANNNLRDDSQDVTISSANYTVNDIEQENLCPLIERQPRVQSTNPEDGDGMAGKEAKAVCRNAKLNIFFDSEMNQNTINKQNIKIGTCPENVVSKNVITKSGILKGTLAFIKNVVSKLFRIDRLATAQTLPCTLLTEEQYDLEIDNDIFDTSKVSIVPEALLEPGIVYTVSIAGGDNGVQDIKGAILDYSNTPRTVSGTEAYIYQFKTLGTPGDLQTGICDVQWIDIKVYRQEPTVENTDPYLAGRKSEIRNNDLFICAGKDNCKLVVDYDQDSGQSGNQHIYEAEAKYNYSLELRANYQWSKTDALDPQKVMSLYNLEQTGGDTEPDDYKVKNETGVTFTTAAPVKEAVAKLVIEAQAMGSRATPAQKEFIVYLLLCENPWPSINEKFPISSIINAFNFQTYYCRDAGRPGDTSDDLPAAKWLAPKEGNLKVLQNTDFEFGNLTYWVEWAGQAFQSQPVFRDLSLERGFASANIQGAWWLNTFERYRGNAWEKISTVQGNEPTGVLSSNAFVIEGDEIKFRIGGNYYPWPDSYLGQLVPYAPPANVTAVILGIRGEGENDFTVKYKESGNNSTPFTMRDVSFEINSTDIGKTGIIYIYDNNTNGFISFDYLRQLNNGKAIPIRF